MKEWIKELCPEIEDWQADAIAEHVAEAIKSEREACARVCDERVKGYQYETDIYASEHINEAKQCAAAIRARGGE